MGFVLSPALTKSHCQMQQACALIALYEHEAHKKVLSAFYIAHAILVKYTVEGTPKLPTPSLLSKVI